MQFSYYIKSLLIFIVFILITDTVFAQRALVPTPGAYHAARPHHTRMVSQMNWVRNILNSGRRGESLDSITDENGYTPLMLAVSYVVNIHNLPFIPSLLDTDIWIGMITDLLKAGANPVQPVTIGGTTTHPLAEAMNYYHSYGPLGMLDDIERVLFRDITEDPHERIVNRIILLLIRARDIRNGVLSWVE